MKNKKISVQNFGYTPSPYFLSFPTLEIAKEFIEKYRDLIMIAKPILRN